MSEEKKKWKKTSYSFKDEQQLLNFANVYINSSHDGIFHCSQSPIVTIHVNNFCI